MHEYFQNNHVHLFIWSKIKKTTAEFSNGNAQLWIEQATLVFMVDCQGVSPCFLMKMGLNQP